MTTQLIAILVLFIAWSAGCVLVKKPQGIAYGAIGAVCLSALSVSIGLLVEHTHPSNSPVPQVITRQGDE